MQSLCSTKPVALAGHSSQRVVRVNALSGDQLKRPELKRPEQPKKLFDDAAGASAPVATHSAAPAAATPAAAAAPSSGAVTIEYQRQRAKEMRQFYENAKLEQLTTKSQVFGWTQKNEISNGRWVMFGFLVGMMTEYATGVDFIHQIEQTISYLGLWDFE